MKIRIAALLLAAVPALASSPSLWEMSTFADFIKGRFDGVSLQRDGRLSIAPKLDPLFSSDQPVVWSVVSGADGSLYAATGHQGRVYRIDASGKSSLLWTADRPEVFALSIDARGVLYAATSPNGKIWRIENGKATEYFDPHATYIWSLALAADGRLYAGTGGEESGKVFRITGAAKGDVYYATGQSNVTGLLLDSQGRLLAGTEPNGILYRITAKDKAFTLYDSTLPEIRAMTIGPDGSVYAVGLGGALAKKQQAAQQSSQSASDSGSTVTTSITVTAQAGGEIKPVPPEAPKPSTSAAATTTTSAAASVYDSGNVEKSAIYRIRPDNTVDTLWSSKEENAYDILLASDGNLWFGTDQNARVYRLSTDRKVALIAQPNDGEAVRILSGKNGSVMVATANMGHIYNLSATGSSGTYESPVFDASGAARWGRIRWQGEGTATIRTRSGNSLRPDETWSEWSPPLNDAKGSQVASPNARYLQFKAEFTGRDTFIDNVTAVYLPQNNPPVVRSLTVLTQGTSAGSGANQKATSGNTSSAATAPYTITVTDTGDAAPTASTGTPTQTLSRAIPQQMLLSWQAEDPDGDRLVYQLEFRGEGEREWKTLRRDLHENTVTLDGDALADGRYLFRVTASDREANPPDSAKESDLISTPVLIDNTPPAIRIQSNARSGKAVDIAFEASDAASLLRRAEWSLDAGPWMTIAPVDGILDSETEQFRLHLADVPAGEHVLVIRVADSGNNAALAKVILR